MSTATTVEPPGDAKVKPIDYGQRGSVVYVTLISDLHEQLREIALKALPYWSQTLELKRALRGKSAVVLHQGKNDYGNALTFAEKALAEFDAEFAFTFDLVDVIGFDQAGDQFRDFYDNACGTEDGPFGNSLEFTNLTARRGKRVEAPANDTAFQTVDSGPEFDGDPQPIVAALLKLPAFDAELIPGPFRPWLLDIADRGCFPIEYVASTLIVMLSGLIGRKLAIRPKRCDDWTVVANLWGAIVGPPGFLKTPAVEAVQKPIKRLIGEVENAHADEAKQHMERQLIAAARKTGAKKKLEAAAKNTDTPEDELQKLAREVLGGSSESAPKCRRYIVNDFTVEKLGELMVENPNGLIVFRDELTGLLNTLNREGHQSDRGFLLESWNGTGPYTFDRIGRGTHHIPAACLALFGTIQPGPLAKYMKGSISGEEADGFIPRFQLLVYPDPPAKYVLVDRWPDKDARDEAYHVFKAIDDLTPLERGCQADDYSELPFVRFAPDAQNHFDQWYTALRSRLQNGTLSNVMAAHLAKFGSLMPSLALILHLVDRYNCQHIGDVSLKSTQAAMAWCELLEAHARRIYQSATDGDISDAVNLAERIANSLPNPFTCREVAQKGWAGLGTAESVRHAVGVLEDRKVVKVVETASGDSLGRGRPSEKVWINPKFRADSVEVSA